MRNIGKEVISKSKTSGTMKEKLAAKKAGTAPVKAKPATVKERLAAKKSATAPAPTAKPAPAPTTATVTPAMQKKKMVSKKTAYDIKQASNQKLTAGARKHYAMNAQAAMKNQKKK